MNKTNKVLILNRSLLSISVFVAAVFLIFYIFQIVSVNKTIFLINSRQKAIDGLSQENKLLEINFSKMISLKNIENLAQKLNFEKAKDIHYIRVLQAPVASAKQ